MVKALRGACGRIARDQRLQARAADVRFSNRALLSSSVFLSVCCQLAWVTLLYVIGLADCAGCHKHWSEGGGGSLNSLALR